MNFVPRAERYDLSFPVVFQHEGGMVEGQCLNVSETGMLVRFQGQVEFGMEGELRGQVGISRLLLHVRVVWSLQGRVAMVFRLHSEEERQAVQSLVAVAAARASMVGGNSPS